MEGKLISIMGQTVGIEGPGVILWAVGGLIALWVGMKVIKVVTGLVARLIWIGALIGAVIWVVWTLTDSSGGGGL